MRYGCSPVSSRTRMPPSMRRKMRRPYEMSEHGEVAAPEHAFGVEIARTVESAFDRVAPRAQQPPAMLERERGWRLGTEVVRGHRPGKRDRAGVSERRQLEGCEVAVPQPPFSACGDRVEIQAVEQARPAISAAAGDCKIDARIVGHAHDRGDPVIVSRREALPARADSRVDHDAVASRLEQCHGALDRRGIGRESGGRVQADAVARVRHRRAAKKSRNSRPHASRANPPVTLVW